MKKLGIFYTNNLIALPILETVITHIQEAAAFARIDLLACSYQPLSTWTYPQQQSKIHDSGVLSLVVQILQLLYSYRKKGYDVVSFLEHDVLYPLNYFTYPEFDNNFLHCSNYRQLTTEGFQDYYWDCYPLFTLTMQFEFAIQHFLTIQEKMLTENYWILEPAQEDVYLYFNSLKLLHIKHGQNTTSFFNYFTGNEQTDPEWGGFQEYRKKFQWDVALTEYQTLTSLLRKMRLPEYLRERYLDRKWQSFGYPYLPDSFPLINDLLHPEEVPLCQRLIQEHQQVKSNPLKLRPMSK